ncbi:hypothetical protein [Staphylococcus sp. 231237_7MaSpsaltlick]|uniref:hypothetical protein n=1 Tax=Staphylococcus TaxID=1279 RepID=UPI00370AC35D
MGIFIEYSGLTIQPSKAEINDNANFVISKNSNVLKFTTEEFREIAEFVEKNELSLSELKIINQNNSLDILVSYFNGNKVTFKNLQPIQYQGVITYQVEVVKASKNFRKSFKRP